jgi:hypothetical protein
MTEKQTSGQLYNGLKLEVVTQQGDLPQKPPILLIYGAAGIGLTTLAVTASENALLIDFDDSARRAAFQAKETIIFQKYEHIVEAIHKGWFLAMRSRFDTIILNGLNELVSDSIIPAIQRNFPMTQQPEHFLEMYRLVGEAFQELFATITDAGFAVVITADRAEQKTLAGTDHARWQPAVIGNKVLNIVMNRADMVGFLHMVGGDIRYLSWNPSASYEAKNSAGLPTLKVESGGNDDFRSLLANHVIKPLAEMQKNMLSGSRATLINSFESSLLQAPNQQAINTLKTQINSLAADLQFVLAGSVEAAEKRVKPLGAVDMEAIKSIVRSSPKFANKFPESMQVADPSDHSEMLAKLAGQKDLSLDNPANATFLGYNEDDVNMAIDAMQPTGINPADVMVAGQKFSFVQQEAHTATEEELKLMAQTISAAQKIQQQASQSDDVVPTDFIHIPDAELKAIDTLSSNVQKIASTFGAIVDIPTASQHNSNEMVAQAVLALTGVAELLKRKDAINIETVKTWALVPRLQKMYNFTPEMVSAFSAEQWQHIIMEANNSIKAKIALNESEMPDGSDESDDLDLPF